ncbi:MAG: archaeosortase/exosortase family protein, partial [Spirochaetia bacterium]|nr:archaeosortase/exosortase family protein [Spirochaetia bacterium]
VLVAAGTLLARGSLILAGAFAGTLGAAGLAGMVFRLPAYSLIFAVPPFSQAFALLGGFHLRAFFTAKAAAILSLMDPAVESRGNLLLFLGKWWSVDPVCEGIGLGIGAGLAALAFGLKSDRTGRLLIFGSFLPLWALCNVLRIVTLIALRLPPGTTGHGIAGLVLFGSIVVFPAAAFALLFPALDREQARELPFQCPSVAGGASRPVALFAIFFVSAASLYGFHRTLLDRTTVQKGGEATLITKRDLFPLGTGHHPRICFEAVGFVFVGEEDVMLAHGQARLALLRPPREPTDADGSVRRNTYLVWWYAWKGSVSSSEWAWRRAVLSGKHVVQHNVFASSRESALKAAEQVATAAP